MLKWNCVSVKRLCLSNWTSVRPRSKLFRRNFNFALLLQIDALCFIQCLRYRKKIVDKYVFFSCHGHLNEVLSKIDIWQLLMIIVAFQTNCTQLLNFFTKRAHFAVLSLFILQYWFSNYSWVSKIPAIGTYIQQLHVMGSPVFNKHCLFHCKYTYKTNLMGSHRSRYACRTCCNTSCRPAFNCFIF